MDQLKEAAGLAARLDMTLLQLYPEDTAASQPYFVDHCRPTWTRRTRVGQLSGENPHAAHTTLVHVAGTVVPDMQISMDNVTVMSSQSCEQPTWDSGRRSLSLRSR